MMVGEMLHPGTCVFAGASPESLGMAVRGMDCAGDMERRVIGAGEGVWNAKGVWNANGAKGRENRERKPARGVQLNAGIA